MKKWFLIIILWPLWVFALLGLLVLGPFSWALQAVDKNAFISDQEMWYLFGAILAVLALSLIFSVYTLKSSFNKGQASKTFILWLMPLLIGGTVVFLWKQPEAREKIIQAAPTSAYVKVHSNMTVGPYPSEEMLIDLKDEGFRTIAYLQDPIRMSEKERYQVTRVMLQVEMMDLQWYPILAYDTATQVFNRTGLEKLMRYTPKKTYLFGPDKFDLPGFAREFMEGQNQ
ncbi:MAG: alkaline shock response membrane anchor protein AmaP [Hydrotalea sp.]|nr:alkaline shock response membrane anchor protein AmaP [Hydrotalea sp.]